MHILIHISKCFHLVKEDAIKQTEGEKKQEFSAPSPVNNNIVKSLFRISAENELLFSKAELKVL